MNQVRLPLASRDIVRLLMMPYSHIVRTIRDGEPRTATSTFTQLLSLFVPVCFTSTETIRTIRDGGALDGHLDFH